MDPESFLCSQAVHDDIAKGAREEGAKAEREQLLDELDSCERTYLEGKWYVLFKISRITELRDGQGLDPR